MAIDFTLAPEHEEIRARVRSFIQDTVQPRVRGFDDETRVASRDEYLVTILELREEAKRAGLWLPHMPKEWGGMGLGHVELAMVQSEAGKTRLGPWILNCMAPDEGNMHTLLHWGTDEQKEQLPAPTVRRHRHVVLRNDRARGGRLRPDADSDPGRRGRRRMDHQRAQVVHLERAPGPVRHPGRPDRARCPGGFTRCEHRLPGRPPRRGVERRARGRDDARVDRPLRDRHRGPARARLADPRWARQRPPPRAVPPRTGPPGPLHALDRPGRDGARHDGGPVAQPLLPRLAPGREAGRAVAASPIRPWSCTSAS